MEELKKAFYEVMYSYEKAFTEEGVMSNLNAWAEAKAPLIELLRRHPDWNEQAKAVVMQYNEGRSIQGDIIDEAAFNLLTVVNDVIPADRRDAFLTAFNAAVAEHSSTLSDATLEIIRQNGKIKCVTGQKTSRIIGKLCHQFGIDSYKPYNAAYAQLADALNPLIIEKTAILSVHPCDYLEMSGMINTWTSCHNIKNGRYQSGTLSYMADTVSMVFYTVDPGITEYFYRAPKRIRQMFFYQEGCLYQSRMYPKDAIESMEQQRSIVHKILSTCLGVNNLWKLKTKREELTYCKSSEGSGQYPDYNFHGNISYLKGLEEIPNMMIGKRPLCVCCGQPFSAFHSIKCNCPDMVVCKECGRAVSKSNALYQNGAFYCKACLHICAVCGQAVLDNAMFPALNRRGRPIEVCRACYESSMEPCFACSIRDICAIIGNSLCEHVAIQPAAVEEVR